MKKILALLFLSALVCLNACSLYSLKSAEISDFVQQIEKEQEQEQEQEQEVVIDKPKGVFEDGIYVVDAINETMTVVDVITNETGTYDDNSIILPRIEANHPAVEAFNEHIISDYQHSYDLVSEPYSDSSLFDIDYDYQIMDGMVAIVINAKTGHQYSSWYRTYNTYYFDTKTCEEITFDEYLQRLGLTFDEATQKVNKQMKIENIFFTKDDVDNSGMVIKTYDALETKDQEHYMLGAVFGEEKSIVVYRGFDLMDGYVQQRMELGSIFN